MEVEQNLINSFRKGSAMRSKKTKQASIKERVVKLFRGKETLTTRDVYKKINKGKRSRQQASIAGVRRAVHILVDAKQLKVHGTNRKMWVLQRRK